MKRGPVCKGLLRGEVQILLAFVVGSRAHNIDDPHDSHDDVQECSAPKRAPLGKNPKPTAMKFVAKKWKHAQSDRKSGGKALGPCHSRVQQAKTAPST